MLLKVRLLFRVVTLQMVAVPYVVRFELIVTGLLKDVEPPTMMLLVTERALLKVETPLTFKALDREVAPLTQRLLVTVRTLLRVVTPLTLKVLLKLNGLSANMLLLNVNTPLIVTLL